MENSFNNNTQSVQNANQTSIYVSMVIGALIAIFGAYIRFAYDSKMMSIIAWVILFAGVVFCVKGVFKILSA